jgi:phytoene synthase
LPAVVHTITAFGLDREDFVSFLRSMEMDLSICEYASYADLLGYMEGSAAAIGTMMLPLLQPANAAAAREPARQLGIAFQLTNFIRDVAEDLDRGRVYLPREDLDRFGVTAQSLASARRRGQADEPIRDLIRFEVDRARAHYALAAPGVPMLAPASQGCIRTAFRLYASILDQVQRQGYDVFAGRAVVPRRTRLRVAALSLLTPPGRPVSIDAHPLPARS